MAGAHTTFTNGVTLTDAGWFQDVDTVAYTLFGNGTSYTGVLTLAGTTQSTSTTTGQAIIAGGMGLAKNLWVGGTGNFAGAVTLQAALTYGGVALTNAVTGTGKMVLDTSPTIATPIINSAAHVGGTWVADATWTLPAYTLGGTITGGSQTISNVGKVLIGTATDGAGYGISGALTASSTGTNTGLVTKTNSTAYYPIICWNADTTGDNVFEIFATEAGGTTRGLIDYNRGGGVTRYNTTSDMTLKTLIGDAPLSKSKSILLSTVLREYFWNDDPTKKPQIAPFAQELYTTFKGAVSVGGYQDIVDADGKVTGKRYIPWSVDKTAFTFHLVAGWQDHESRMKAIEAKLGIQ